MTSSCSLVFGSSYRIMEFPFDEVCIEVWWCWGNVGETAAKEKPFSIVSEYIYDDFSGETAYSQAFFAMPCTPVSDNHVMSTTCGQRKMINYKNWKCDVRNEEKPLGISKTFHSGVESDSKQYPLVVPNPRSRHDSQAHNSHPQPQCQTHAKHKLLRNDRLGWGWRMIRTAD